MDDNTAKELFIREELRKLAPTATAEDIELTFRNIKLINSLENIYRIIHYEK